MSDKRAPCPNEGINPDLSKVEASLAKSREEIRAITRSILDLASSRQRASLRVSEDKAILGEAIANPAVERNLLAESLEYARSIGLDEEFARTLVLDLMKFSKLAQSRYVYGRQARKYLEERNIKTVGIIGSGRMGIWFARYFLDLSAHVILYDEKVGKGSAKSKEIGADYRESLDETANSSDLLIVSAPISKTPKIILELASSAQRYSRQLTVIEVSSIKNELVASGLYSGDKLGSISLYSIHPLFGSSAGFFEANSIVQSLPKDTTLIRGLFPHYSIVSLDWKEHDRLMGIFLTLPHALALAFADSIRREKDLWDEVGRLSGPSYSRMLDLSKKVLAEDPEIYFEIQSSNPNSKEIIAFAMNSLLKLEKVLDNRSDFVRFFEAAREKIRELEEMQSGGC